ncbi:tyrosine-type recombinase/integrase [Mesorhizobium caraganae]
MLEAARTDNTPTRLRDHAIFQILATYGVRAGEICSLRIEDIDWRSEAIRVHYCKTQSCSLLPRHLAPVPPVRRTARRKDGGGDHAG